MRLLTLSALTLGMTAAVWAQNASTLNPVRPMPIPPNASPFGNILFPGGLGKNTRPPSIPSGITTIPSGLGFPQGTRPGGRPSDGGGHGRGRTVVVPYAVPVFYGGGYYDGYYPQPQQQPNVTVVVPQQAPQVIIHQTFGSGTELVRQEVSSADTPDSGGGLRVYEPGKPAEKPAAAPAPQAAGSYARDEKPNIYLIAMKDSTVRQAIGYWVEGATLSYVTPQASIHRVGLDTVDRDLSVQLNAERKLEFDLTAR